MWWIGPPDEEGEVLYAFRSIRSGKRSEEQEEVPFVGERDKRLAIRGGLVSVKPTYLPAA